MKQFTHEVKDPMGLHARPAGLLVKACAAYQSVITLSTPTTKADARRLMAVMRMGVKQGTPLTVTCEGPDEEQAAAELQAYLAENI